MGPVETLENIKFSVHGFAQGTRIKVNGMDITNGVSSLRIEYSADSPYPRCTLELVPERLYIAHPALLRMEQENVETAEEAVRNAEEDWEARPA